MTLKLTDNQYGWLT